MFNFTAYAHLRYVLLINIITSLIPAMSVKGRANDPLLHATWWSSDRHSAVLVVSVASILGAALAFILVRKDIRAWWAYVGCGIVVGDFPATFYLLATPSIDAANLPLADMYMNGTVSGVIAGFVLRAVLAKRKQVSPA
jgi:hypothetical protein